MNFINNNIMHNEEGGIYKSHRYSIIPLLAIFKTVFLCIIMLIFGVSCKKIVQIPPPATSITTSQVFADSANATSAIVGIYSTLMYSGGYGFCNGAQTVFLGLSSDELSVFSTGNSNVTQFYINALQLNNGSVPNFFWNQPYKYIYRANACIEGIQSSSNISQTTKDQLIGEAKFLRALFHFYLVNLFGDVPFITSTDWQITNIAGRIPKTEVYQQIINDLKDAQTLLRNDYSISSGLRTRVNQWAATALLARVYLYIGDWTNAEKQSTTIISNTAIFNLVPNLNSVFSTSSSEAILQWQLNTSYGYYNCTTEGYNIIPTSHTTFPSYYLSTHQMSAFESGDQRRISWVDSTIYQNKVYYYPYKYKKGPSQRTLNGTATEYYTVLRLAEQYLIRAEARAQQNNINGAINDLNSVRSRAGLANLSSSLTQAQVLTAVEQERRIELFAEWGHRWLDLKRTGRVDAVMSKVTPQKNGAGVWNSYQQLYPIPSSELARDPFLSQNPGY